MRSRFNNCPPLFPIHTAIVIVKLLVFPIDIAYVLSNIDLFFLMSLYRTDFSLKNKKHTNTSGVFELQLMLNSIHVHNFFICVLGRICTFSFQQEYIVCPNTFFIYFWSFSLSQTRFWKMNSSLKRGISRSHIFRSKEMKRSLFFFST